MHATALTLATPTRTHVRAGQNSRLGKKSPRYGIHLRASALSHSRVWRKPPEVRRTASDRSVYNYFRDYDPGTGRYIQSDPIGLAGGLNTYGYVGGNPLSAIDPFGLQTANSLTNVCARDPFHPACSAGAAGHASGATNTAGVSLWCLLSGSCQTNEKAEECPENPPPIPDNWGASPGEGWEWKGKGQPESGKGNWVNPETGQKIHPDAHHLPPKGPHWGLTNPDGTKWDYFPNTGKWEPSK